MGMKEPGPEGLATMYRVSAWVASLAVVIAVSPAWGQGREGERARLRDAVRAALEKLLSPEQRASVVAEGQADFIAQRLEESAAGNRGSIDAMAGTLDQLRQADARTYTAQRQMFALRESD